MDSARLELLEESVHVALRVIHARLERLEEQVTELRAAEAADDGWCGAYSESGAEDMRCEQPLGHGGDHTCDDGRISWGRR